MKKLFFCSLLAILCSGCGVAKFAANAAISPVSTAANISGTVVGAGFVANMPNQQSDWADNN